MYDTLNLWLNSCDVPDIKNCTNAIQITDESRERIQGNLGNMKLTIKQTGIFVTGSLARFYFGNNQTVLTKKTTKLAIEMLADTLHLPIIQANIFRIDFANNIPVKQKENLYYPLLGKANHYTRLLQPDSLYYTNKQRQLLFYAKRTEQKAKHIAILPIYENKNLLRYEMRLQKKIKQQLNVPDLKAAILFEPTFYHNLIKRWQREYFAIYKENKLIINHLPNIDTMSSRKTFEKYLMQIGIEALGGANEVLEIVQSAKDLNYFSNKMQPARLKEAIKEAANYNAGITSRNELIQELDKKINEVARLHL